MAEPSNHPDAVEDVMVASAGLRLLGWFLDSVIVAVVLTPLNPFLYADPPSVAFATSLWAVAMVLMFLYGVLFDGGQRGATLGKRIVGTRVGNERTGAPIGYRRATIRRLGYWLGGLAFCIGWLRLLFNPRRQAWHDRFAHSVVVKTRASTEESRTGTSGASSELGDRYSYFGFLQNLARQSERRPRGD